MDYRDKNIYYGLVTDENSTTELLCNLLQFKPLRSAILELFLERDVINRVEFEDCDTQNFLSDNNGRPDLIIQNDEVEIIFEIKIDDANLTNNQPVSYLEYLSKRNSNKKWLIFLIPEDYVHEKTWNEKCVNYLVKVQDSGIEIRTIYWQQVIKKIEEYDLPGISQCFNDFVVVLKKWFEREPIKFTYPEVKLMFTDQIPKVITQLCKVIDYVREDLVREFGNKVYISRRPYSSNAEYGIKIENQEFLHFWFGIWHPYWEKYKKPLWFGIEDGYDPKVMNTFKQSNHQRMEYDDGWYYSWIGEDLLYEENCQKNISSLIIKQVKDLLAVIE